MTRAWLLAMVFTFLIFVWPAAGSQADDDVAIRALTQKFLTAYDNKDLASVISMCGQKSADLNAIKQVSEQVFASDVRARFGAPGIQKTVVEGSSAAVTVVWNGSGSGSQSSGETPRVWALGLRKDDEGWRVWRFVPTREELAVALVGSKSDQVVAELLRTYKELLTPELLEALNARGDSLYSAGKFAQAIATFDTALEIAKRLLDDKSIPVILRKAGNACFRLGDFDKAIEYYDKSVKLAELLGDKKLVSAALNNMGLIVFNRGQFNQALEILEKSLRIKQEVGDEAELPATLIAIGKVYGAMSAPAKALEKYQQALELANKFGQKTRSAQALADIALTKKYLGLYEEALQEYFKILAIYEELDDKLGICGTLQLIGAAYLSLGRYQEALDYTEKSQKLAEELGAKPAIAAGLQQLSELHRFAGNYAKALSYADRALKLDTELGLQSRVASVLGVIGSVYYSQHNTDQAREYYDKCLAIREQLGEKLGLIDALNSRGLVETMNGAHDKAIEYYKRGLNLAEELGDNVGIRISLSYLASDYIALGDTERARVLLERGLGLAEEQGDRLAIGHLLLGLAEIRYKSGDYIKALDLADRSAQLAKETYAQGFVQACTSRGRALRRLNRPEEAFKALSEAINTVESLRYQVIGPEQDRARFYADKASSYLEMVDLLVEKGRLGEALAFAERFKGRTLLEALQTGVTDKTLTAAMTADEREREGKLDADLRSLNIQLFVENQSKRNDEARLTILRENLQKRRLEYEAFRTGLYAAHPELGVKRGDLRTVNLDEAATLVAQRKSAVLEYVVGPEGCYLFLLTQGNRRNRAPLGNNQPESRRSNSEMERLKLQVFPIDVKEDKLTSLVEALRTRLANRSFEYQTLTSQLYDLLLGPARDQLRGQTSLIIIPDGPLWSLPFQALQGHNRHFLIEDFAISYAPSLTVLREMIEAEKKSEKPAVDPESLLAFGNPDFGSTGEAVLVLGEPLGPIPDAERQVRQLSQLYGPGHWKIYTGRDALEERVKVEAGKYGILHFATHGVFDDASPMHSYLVLARDAAGKDDGLLEASEVMNLDLRAKLAVLSACETGRGQVTSGEGLIGFTWAFFVAGCPSTVVSLWKVESGSATEMMLEFHRNLRQDLRANAGMSKAEALRRSALKLLRSERYRHPAFWAAFVIVGEGR